jgi:hypothetical protein
MFRPEFPALETESEFRLQWGSQESELKVRIPNQGNKLPPEHTFIIISYIISSVSTKSQQRSGRHLRNCIITSCSDADVMMGTKHIDPALCICIGEYLICIDNKHLKDKAPRENGTLCRVLSVKLRENAPWFNTKDVEWVQYEHVHKPGHMSQLELQINDLEKVTDKHQNKSKLHDLKERLTKKMNSPKYERPKE